MRPHLKQNIMFVSGLPGKPRCCGSGNWISKAAIAGASSVQNIRKHQWLDRWDERGAWVHKFPERSTRGFWLSGMYNPWISWETLVIEFKEANRLAKAGDQEQLKVFLNTRLAELWEMRGESLDEDLFRTRREVYPARLPGGVKVLTAAADIQDDRICYEIAGWGVGRERWAIEYGPFWGDPLNDDVWERLDKILIEGRWEYSDGEKAKVSCAFVDSGGHLRRTQNRLD